MGWHFGSSGIDSFAVQLCSCFTLCLLSSSTDTATAPLTLSKWLCHLLYWDDHNNPTLIPRFPSTPQHAGAASPPIVPSYHGKVMTSELPPTAPTFLMEIQIQHDQIGHLSPQTSRFSWFSFVFWEHPILTITILLFPFFHNQGSNPVCSTSAISFASSFPSYF